MAVLSWNVNCKSSQLAREQYKDSVDSVTSRGEKFMCWFFPPWNMSCLFILTIDFNEYVEFMPIFTTQYYPAFHKSTSFLITFPALLSISFPFSHSQHYYFCITAYRDTSFGLILYRKSPFYLSICNDDYLSKTLFGGRDHMLKKHIYKDN